VERFVQVSVTGNRAHVQAIALDGSTIEEFAWEPHGAN